MPKQSCRGGRRSPATCRVRGAQAASSSARARAAASADSATTDYFDGVTGIIPIVGDGPRARTASGDEDDALGTVVDAAGIAGGCLRQLCANKKLRGDKGKSQRKRERNAQAMRGREESSRRTCG